MNKVCHMTSAHPVYDIRIYHKECCSLAKLGYEVYLVAPNCKEEVNHGVHIVSTTVEGNGRFNRMWKKGRAVYKKALEIDADVYHFHDPELLRFALRLKRKGKVVIYDAHEDVPKQILDKHWIPRFARKFISFSFGRYERFVAKRISGVISVTETICKRFKLANPRVEMVANYPLMLETKALREIEEEVVEGRVAYVGGLFPTRGVKELVQAMEYLDAELVLAGTFSPPEFQEEVSKLKGWEKVDYRGQVSREELLHILKSTHIGMVTLHPTASYKEALPIKMFEYMSAGIPFVASNFPFWKEIIDAENCGIVADPLSPVDIAKAIQWLFEHPERAKSMGNNGYKAFMTKYNWDKEEEKLHAFYKRLIHA
jgi:glycosyltransferase involved in cell wall biosynthesis